MRLIDADALKERIRKALGIKSFNNLLPSEKVIVKQIDMESTIQPEPHWIPVTEATPTEEDDYWCTFDAETGRFVDWCSWYQGRWMEWTDDTVSEVRNVVAWCKPMEPYKEVTE